MFKLRSWISSLYVRLLGLRAEGSRSIRRASRTTNPCFVEYLEPRKLLSAVAVGSESLVNTTKTADQQANSLGQGGAVAMDADGDYVVTWTSSEQDPDGSYGVYAQRYDAAGVKQGSEFRVNTTTVGKQKNATVAMDTAGNFVITWMSDAQDGDGYGIYAQRYNAAGTKLGSEFRVNTTTTNDQINAAVAMDAAGNFVITWTSIGQDADATDGVYAQRYNASGTKLGGEFRVASTIANDQTESRIAMDSDGDFVITWTSAGQDGGGNGIYAQRFNSSGVAQGSEFRVNTATLGDQELSVVEMDNTGNFVIAWQSDAQDGEGYGIYAQRYNAAGVAQGSEFRVNTTTALDQAGPSIAMDAVGNFVVTWASYYQDGSYDGVYAQRFNAAGVAQGTEFRINTRTDDSQAEASVAMDAAGDFVVVWNSYGQDTGGYGVYSQRYQSTGDVVLNGSALSIRGTTQADVISVTTGSSLTVTMNGTNYNFTPASVTSITIDGVYGNDTITINSVTSGVGVLVDGGAGSDTITVKNTVLVATTLLGGEGNDTLTGGGGNDTLNGGIGNDTYSFDTDLALGSDTINESAGGTDTLNFSATSARAIAVNLGTAGAQVINAGLTLSLGSASTIENIIGGSLGDTLTGNSLDNTLTGGGGNDTLTGAAGNDTYLFDTDLALGADTISEAGGGIDTLNFSGTTTRSISINLATTAAQVVNAGLTLTLGSDATIENVVGGELNDSLTGNSLANSITGGGGNDLLAGAAGDDSYIFDTDLSLGSDTINEASGGVDTLDFSATTTRSISINLANAAAQVVNSGLTLTLGATNTLENLVGGGLADTLVGNLLDNTITGGGGNDTLTGGAGNDTYLFDTDLALGADTINETGGGIDSLNFSGTTTRSISINLGNAAAQVVNAGLTLTLGSATTMENIVGGNLADTLTGNSLANSLTGGGGNDTLVGGAENDVYVFDSDAACGTDTINESGGGIDTLDFSLTTTRSVTANLATATSQVVNAGLTLILSSATTIENVLGGALADNFTGNSLSNSLVGLGGNDTLLGAEARDILIGGAGLDTLDGGNGEDLLIGGTGFFSNHLTALPALMAEWNSGSTFADRMAHLLGTLAGGLNGATVLNSTTIKEDGAADTLKGGADKDWYLRNNLSAIVANRDTVTDADVAPSDSVFTEISTWV